MRRRFWLRFFKQTAIVLILKEERKIRVLYAEEFEKANPQDIVNICFDMYRKHWNTLLFVDGANRAAVNLMKVAFNESLNWEKQNIESKLYDRIACKLFN